MKGHNNILSAMTALIAVFLILSSFGSAASVGQPIGVDIVKVVVNGVEVTGQEDLKTQFLRGDTLDIIVVLNASETQNNVEAEAFISGDENHNIADKTQTFDVEANTQYQRVFSLSLPNDVQQDNYKLRIMITNRYGAIYYQNYNMKIDTQRHQVFIKDIDFNPNTEIKAGRSFTSIVRVENSGEKDEDSVKVTMAIPSLGLSASDYIDNLKADEKKSSEELYIRLPDCAKAGQYDVTFSVKYNNDYSEAKDNRTITVTEGDGCGTVTSPKTTIVVGNNVQKVSKGSTAAYDLTIANGDQTAKTYTITLDNTADWAAISVTPSNVLIVGAGETKIAVIGVTPANDAAIGQKTFTAKISAADQLVKEIPLVADIQKANVTAWDSVKLGLEIGLIVLAVTLIVLGSIIMIRKAKEGKDSEELNTEEMSGADGVDTYY